MTGERHDTDLVELAAEHGETLYPVHRIDKVTSGLILLAKDLPAHGTLTRQFNKRTADKWYLAVTATTDLPDRGIIDLPLSVGRKNRVRIAAPREAITRTGDTWSVADRDLLAGKNYPSRTDFTTLLRTDTHTVLAVHPRTGRRHQIQHPRLPPRCLQSQLPRVQMGALVRSRPVEQGVAREGVADPGQVDADLVAAAGAGVDFWTVGGGVITGDPEELLTGVRLDG
nr:RNA pseudouridine synthase [Nocardia terpenica]